MGSSVEVHVQIKFKRLELDGFMSYQHITIDLEDRGYTRVCGINNNQSDNAVSNGAGKSAWSDAIVWALTGETIRGAKNVANIYLNQGCWVKLDFEVNGDDYSILRSRDHKEYKSNLKIYINGVDKSGKGLRDSEKLLSDYLPDLSASFIGSVIILGQGMPERFTKNTPSGRKEILEQLSGSDFMIQDLKDRLQKRATFLSQQLRALSDENIKLSTSIDLIKAHIIEVNKNIESLDNADQLLATVSTLSDQLNSLKANRKVLDEKLTEVNLEIKSLNAEIIQIQNQRYADERAAIDSISNLVTEAHSTRATLKAEHASLTAEIKRLESIRDTCPTCGQKLKDIIKPDTSGLRSRLESVTAELSTINTTLEELELAKTNQLNSIKAKYSTIEKTNQAKNDELSRSLINLERDIENQDYQISSKNAELFKIEAQLDSIETLKKNLADTLSDLENNLESINTNLLYNVEESRKLSEHKKVVDKFLTLTARDFRGYLLSNVIEFIDKKAKQYCMDIFDTEAISFVLNNNNIDICYSGKSIEALSGGEQQKINLIIQLALRDMLCSFMDFRCNLFVLDEILDNVDAHGSQKILNLISKKLFDIESIFIITHHDNELNIPYDNELYIIKDENGISSLR